MKKYFALYLVPPAEIQKMMAHLTPEQMKEMDEKWKKWQEEHKESFVELGTILGKTKRVTTAGVSDVKNDLTGYSIIQAESHEAAAQLFADQPHLSMPGASVEVMEMKDM